MSRQDTVQLADKKSRTMGSVLERRIPIQAPSAKRSRSPQTSAFVAAEVRKWKSVAAAAKIQVD